MLAEQVSDRLALVLADRPPRRAQPAPEQVASAATSEVAPPASAAVETLAPMHIRPDGLPDPPGPVDLDDLPPTRRFGRAHLGVLSALVVVGLLVAGWSLFRARPVALAVPGPVGGSASTPQPSTSASSAASTKSTIVVHVLGAVHKPGLVTLPDRARVQDAITAAGGLRSNADPGELNLAQLLSDGQQVVIGSKRAPAGEVRDGGGGGGNSPGSTSRPGGGAASVVDLNRATEAQLEALPGVGPVTAGKILAWRQLHTRFARVEELQEVDGIGPKTYAQIAPHVRV
jgi:competence protein ComEA